MPKESDPRIDPNSIYSKAERAHATAHDEARKKKLTSDLEGPGPKRWAEALSEEGEVKNPTQFPDGTIEHELSDEDLEEIDELELEVDEDDKN